MGVFLELGAALVAAANAGAGADADACLVAPVLQAADGSPHQTCVDAVLEGGSALLVGAGDH